MAERLRDEPVWRCPNLRSNLRWLAAPAILWFVLIGWAYEISLFVAPMLWLLAQIVTLVAALRIALRRRKNNGPSDLWCARAALVVIGMACVPPIGLRLADCAHLLRLRASFDALVPSK